MKPVHKLLVLFLMLVTACKEQGPETPTPEPTPDAKGFYLIVKHSFDGQNINFGTVEYATGQNTVGVSNLSYYLSGFGLQKQDGSWHPINAYHLVVAQAKPIDTLYLGELPEGNYQAIRFHLGIDSVTNHGDPAQWPNDQIRTGPRF